MTKQLGARLATLLAVLLLAACDGDTGPPGPAGPPGPPGEPAPTPPPVTQAADASAIEATITGVTVSSPPVVEFTLEDGNGIPVVNLPASAMSFAIAKLVPGTDGERSAWQSYINRIEEPGVGPGTESKAQATTESGSSGSLVDNGDGTYAYTFATDITGITDPIEVAYDPDLTHRVSFQVRGFAPVRNPHFDFRPADGATENLFTRNIAIMETCNACHQDFSYHGGGRNTVENCVLCHNPGSADANSGNTIDLTVMVHRIHHGKNLPSVIAGEDYCLYGRNDRRSCFGDVAHPQDIRNCQNCHDEAVAATPDASNWYTQPTIESCGTSCHDDVNFETGDGHGRGIPADNPTCVGCHARNPDSRLEVRQAHRILTKEQAAEYAYNILAVDFSGPGSAPMVTFSVTNPLEDDAPYDLANDEVLKASPIRLQVAWETVDIGNWGNGGSNAQPQTTSVYSGGELQATDNGDFTYSLTLSNVAPAATGSGVINMEGRVEGADGRIPVKTATRYFAITDDPLNPVARRKVVDIDRCNDCHEDISFHGGRNNNAIESCQTCHNANAARSGDPSRGPMDIKHFLHRKHAVEDIRYPQPVSNCLGCHLEGSFHPVDVDSGVLATSFDRGSDPLDPSTNTRTSPNSATCSVCHSSGNAQAHMIANGASFDACLESDGVLRERIDFCGPGGDKSGSLVRESCAVCHGPGRSSDTAVVHGID